MYYSIVTVATLGFGDVVPNSESSVYLACIEVVGAIFLMAVLVGTFTRKFMGRL